MTSTASLRQLFESLIELDAQERDRRLEALDLKPADARRLRALLAADANPPAHLSEPAEHLMDRLSCGEDLAAQLIDTDVGPFRLKELIGEGGSSLVFLAERPLPEGVQRVALKLMYGSSYSPGARRRSLREQAILAQLSHPSIARLVDAGVAPAGTPYIAMEYIDGRAITRYADEQGLGLEQRLRLIVTLCAAIDAAHAALIVHCDLKPSNVLIDRQGNLKVLDFGVARLMDTGSDVIEATRTLAFTPEYAAPEQFRRGAPTVAVDIFAVGVLLSELLTGERHRSGDKTLSARVADPDSSGPPNGLPARALLARRLRGDLDAIVAKALAEEPAERYRSAAALAADIDRFLAGRPVAARRGSRWYHVGKFVRRHRTAVAIVSAFALSLVISLAVTVHQSMLARQKADQASLQTQRAEAVRDFLVSVFESAQPDVVRELRPTVEQLVDEAIERAAGDARLDNATRSDLLLTLASVAISLGQHQRALDVIEQDMPENGGSEQAQRTAWLRAQVLRSQALLELARAPEAIALLEPLQSDLAARKDDLGVQGLLLLANARSIGNDYEQANRDYEQARRLAQTFAAGANEAVLTVDIARVRHEVYSARYREALNLADTVWSRWQARASLPSRPVLQLLRDISIAAEAAGDIARAEQAYRDAVDLAERLYQRPHPETAWVVGIYGSFLVAHGRLEEAEPYIVRGLEMRRTVRGEQHPDTLNAIAAMGRLRAEQGRREEALTWFAEGVSTCRSARVEHNVCPRLLGSLGQMLALRNELTSAGELAEEAVDWQRRLTGPDSPQAASAMLFLARVQGMQGRFEQVLTTTGEMLAILERTGAVPSTSRNARHQRAEALFELGRNNEALELISTTIAEHQIQAPDERRLLLTMLTLKARALVRAGRVDEARAAALDILDSEQSLDNLPAAILRNLERLARDGHPF